MTQNMTQNKRQANFEILRTIAMLMVIVLHYLNDARFLPESGMELSDRQAVGAMLESFCIVAVNVYILISGYFMVHAGFKLSRIVRLIGQVLFYSLLIPPILAAAGISVLAEREGIYGLIQYVLPLSTDHYWFATEYVLLYLFSPFLNIGCQKLDKKQLGIILILLLTFFSVIKSVVPVELVTDREGYDFGWFMCLYLTGGYIRLHGLPFLDKRGRNRLLYVGCAAGIGLLAIGLHYLSRSGILAYYYQVPFHYNFILTFGSAVGLFYGFTKIKIKEGKAAALARWLGPLSFGVYLLHMHIDLRYLWFGWTQSIFGAFNRWGWPGWFLNLAATVLLVYTVGIAVDFVRMRIFGLIERAIQEHKGHKNGKKL